jgi:heat shock protein beta
MLIVSKPQHLHRFKYAPYGVQALRFLATDLRHLFARTRFRNVSHHSQVLVLLFVVTSQFGYSAHQEKIMRAQAFQNKDQIQMMAGRKTLQINGNHPVINDLLQKVKDNKDDKKAKETAEVLFQTAMIESGYEIADPSDLASRPYKRMSAQLGVDPDEPVREIELPDDDEEEVAETEEDKDEEVAEEAASDDEKKDEDL